MSGDPVSVKMGRVLQCISDELSDSFMEADRKQAAMAVAFTQLADASRRIADVARARSDEHTARECDVIRQSLYGAVIAFQHQDRLAQRVAQLRHGLTQLSSFLRGETYRSELDRFAELSAVEEGIKVARLRFAAGADIDRGHTAVSSADSAVELF